MDNRTNTPGIIISYLTAAIIGFAAHAIYDYVTESKEDKDIHEKTEEITEYTNPYFTYDTKKTANLREYIEINKTKAKELEKACNSPMWSKLKDREALYRYNDAVNTLNDIIQYLKQADYLFAKGKIPDANSAAIAAETSLDTAFSQLLAAHKLEESSKQ